MLSFNLDKTKFIKIHNCFAFVQQFRSEKEYKNMFTKYTAQILKSVILGLQHISPFVDRLLGSF